MKKHLERGIILLGTFLIAFMGSALNPAIPSIAGEFHTGTAQSGWIVTAYMITCTAFPVPLGRWAEQTEARKILTGGLGVFTVASAVGMITSSMGMLLTIRSMQGIGNAMIYSTGMWILIADAEDGMRGKLLGYSAAAMYLGLAIGPAAGGILNQYLGWRWIFAAAAVISAVAFSGSLILFRNSSSKCTGFPSPGKTLPSGVSVLLYLLAVMAFTTGLQMISAGWWGWCVLTAGLLLLALYTWREWRTDRPLISMKLFRNRPSILRYSIVSMISCGAGFVLSYLLSLYLQIGMGFSSQNTGLVLIAAPAFQAIVSVTAGKLAGEGLKLAGRNRKLSVSPRILAAAGMIGSGAVSAWFAGINEGWTVWKICAGLGAAGVCSGLFSAPNTLELTNTAGKDSVRLASSMISTVRSLGNSIGVASAALVASFVMGQATLRDADPQALAEVVKIVFFAWAALCILGFLMELKEKV